MATRILNALCCKMPANTKCVNKGSYFEFNSGCSLFGVDSWEYCNFGVNAAKRVVVCKPDVMIPVMMYGCLWSPTNIYI